ncbi:hypothetical protein CDAR_528031 [Caerostris darwini]|uniref:Uncharacterized protein n=1 Tax=Caerostris darwini TaxID=1538125 RepID=A0AAV4QS42_9ARAC|nr:hypothetical protein CDAR_528031 [Caerostris darwini]
MYKNLENNEETITSFKRLPVVASQLNALYALKHDFTEENTVLAKISLHHMAKTCQCRCDVFKRSGNNDFRLKTPLPCNTVGEIKFSILDANWGECTAPNMQIDKMADLSYSLCFSGLILI